MQNNKNTHQMILRTSSQTTLLAFLYESLSEQSRSSVKSLLEQKRIMIGGTIITKFDYPLAPDTEVIVLKKGVIFNKPLPFMNLIYEDKAIIVIDKECGLLTVSAGKETEKTAFNILKLYAKEKKFHEEIHVVHRLDRETSGIMIFAKSMDIQQKLQNNWDTAVTKRIYYAVVEGRVQKKEDEIVSWLKENKALKMYSSSTPEDGQKAITRYRVIKSSQRYSLLEVSLETGRKNQIRVHMQDIGHSVAGDKKYGASTDPLRRLALHAGIFECIHPATGECMTFETPIPDSFNSLVE